MSKFSAFSLHRLGHWIYRKNIPILPKITQFAILILFNCYIPYQLQVGNQSRLGHRGIGVVINKESIIGEGVLIRAHVTIGKVVDDGAAPVIGDYVEIGDGAKILGAVTIGDHAKIGANAVVLIDIPPGATAVGIPAKILTKTE